MDTAAGRGIYAAMSDPVAARFLDRTTPPHLLTLVMLTAVSAAAMNIFLPSLPSMAA